VGVGGKNGAVVAVPRVTAAAYVARGAAKMRFNGVENLSTVRIPIGIGVKKIRL